MLVYGNRTKQKKQWGVSLQQIGESAVLVAVDANDNTIIGYIATIDGKGNLCIHSALKDILEEDGYNPDDHNMKYDEQGRILAVLE